MIKSKIINLISFRIRRNSRFGRGGGGLHSIASSKNGILGSVPVQQTPVINKICQVKTINDLCQPLMVTVNKRGWFQQATTYFRCLKSCLDKCPQQEVQNQFQQVEHYLQSQININYPGGIGGCSRHSTDARCKIGLVQSNSTPSCKKQTK
ncbi:unnamed protein product [Rotaria magnacalcarata]|uniref:Uncharacterized protein n=2 Tax=Rotaria magnacalcarata TaxID=392030 RepID=A0A819MQH3_9BILA|nr:unnamed protein product [Rotaria magnacalcarata]CAF4282759.1 unnamed protein product [Rotaria magnacalcarata]CAF4392720.1 unnamed protein product [Rotaria magnacalcarata]